jgi:hypothetical protein
VNICHKPPLLNLPVDTSTLITDLRYQNYEEGAESTLFYQRAAVRLDNSVVVSRTVVAQSIYDHYNKQHPLLGQQRWSL